MLHVSDCSALIGEECDCGGLDLTTYEHHCFMIAFIPSTGRFGFFIDHTGGECFVDPELLPTGTLIAIAAAANLPHTHDRRSDGSCADRMDLDVARPAVISQLKTLALSEGFAS